MKGKILGKDRSWKLHYAALNHAAIQGEEIASIFEFVKPPVDPFAIMDAERELICYDGDDFGDCFDGRIRFVGPRFLICFNTRFNAWPHKGQNHTKILFAIAHELGHFFLPKHRDYLVRSRQSHGSFSEFTSDPLVEQQADFFASGLLMPKYLLGPEVNSSNFVTLDRFHRVRNSFEVSLTGLLVRWTQLSDFPCATIAIKNGKIQFGWTSAALRTRGAFRIRRGDSVSCRAAKDFLEADPSLTRYREGSGSGSIRNWIDFDDYRLQTEEHYFAIPHSGTVWILVVADENDFQDSEFED
ncbi:ImmA/IrrE family metallo-endopeptidase [Aureliella helgolandensis]|uniref:IrrE N-terminal-like domain-containing protein n=1 Tax=Aureliella helgolandensis TaxID=2527968 RepID=A0A518GBS3_9BACT|nr:ImmA/IrrE family metallo-endopeptidase [Aureliella helgolandensis]QDV26038.1 hypothetical protein Q31a_44080 [Aureliella helgolandensis]